jgi:antitoxin component YwqK of YwqJK toxin-antitoxin module
LTVGQDNQATAVIGHVPEADGSVFSQNLPTGRMQLNADGTITFTPLGGESVTVQGKTIQSMADLDALGIKNGITSDLVGKTAFTLTLPGKGQVTFIGSLQDIQAGDYYVAGTNQLIAPKEGQQASTPYLAQYRGGTLAQVSLTDSFNTTIAYQSSDLAKFTVTQTSGDGQRVATMKYENNQLQGYGVEYKAFGVTLLYDAKGGLTPECMQYLRDNSGKGYTLKYTGQGFSLTNNATGFEQFFSSQGRALLNPGKAGTTSGGAQEVMEFDVKQSVNFQVAKYDNGSLGSQAVHFDQISRQYVLLQASAEGVVNKTTITSDIAGKVNSRQVENLNMNQREVGTFSAKGELETGTRNLQAKVMEGRDDQTGNTVRRENVTSFERMENGKVVESTMHLGSLEVRTPENALVQRMTDVNYKNGDIVSAGVLETDKQKMTGVRFTNGNVSYAASLTSGEQHMTAVHFRADGSIESAATLTSGKQHMTGVQFRKDGSISYAATLASGEQRLTGVQFRTDGSISYAATLTSGEQSMTRVNFRADGSIESAATLTSGKQQMTDVRFRTDGSLLSAATLTSGEQKMTQVNFRADGSIESAATLTSGKQQMTGV